MVPAPVIGANSPVAFGNQSVNTSVTKSLTVTNIGIGPLLLTTPTLGGGNANQFTFANGTCPVNNAAGLATGMSCNLSVTFAPTSTGNKAATLTVTASNANNVLVSLTGTGVTPIYSIAPGPLVGHGFGNQQVGTQSAPFALTLTNTAASLGGELWLNGPIVLSGNNANQFAGSFGAATGDCTANTHLAMNASCTFYVAFAPTTAGSKGTSFLAPGARVEVTHVNGAQNVGLTGTPVWGTGAQGTVAFTGASLGTLSNNNGRTLAFGNLTGAPTSTVTLTNSGTFAVTYGTASVSNGTPAAFSKGADGCSGTTVPVNGTCTIIINFAAPTGNNARTGTLSVPSNATNNPATLNLTGS
jgi:hypothetical protein